MKNKNVIYLTTLIEKNKKTMNEVNTMLRLMLHDAEKTCKKYHYDIGACELNCGATYLHKVGDIEMRVSRENCLECNEYEPKKKGAK